jgi:uncharacterized protein YjiS (DUF1127 family)
MSTMDLSISIFRPYRSSRWSEIKRCVAEWHRRVTARSELMSLSDRELSDIGLTPMDRYNASSKPFWQA